MGLKGASVSVEARRSKHWTERSEGSAQRGARAETLGAFWLYGTEPLAPSTLFEHC